PKAVGVKGLPPVKAKAGEAAGDVEVGEGKRGEATVGEEGASGKESEDGVEAGAAGKRPPVLKAVGAKGVPPAALPKAVGVKGLPPVKAKAGEAGGNVEVADVLLFFGIPVLISGEPLKSVGLDLLNELSHSPNSSARFCERKEQNSRFVAGGTLGPKNLVKLSAALLSRASNVQAKSKVLPQTSDGNAPVQTMRTLPSKVNQKGELPINPRLVTSRVDASANQNTPREWVFTSTAFDTELMACQTPDYILTGSIFYSLGPKAAIQCISGLLTTPQTQRPSEVKKHINTPSGFEKIKGLYDSPTDLIPWDSSLRTSASTSCTQICKLPPAQYATAVTVWSELVLYQKSQVIVVVESHNKSIARIVPSLLAGFAYLSGFTINEQMRFIKSVSRIYDALALWTTVVSPGKGEKCVCQWRWIIGFNPNGQARDISLSGCLLSEAPSAEEGVLKIVALCVESALSDKFNPEILGITGVSSKQLQESLLHSGQVEHKNKNKEALSVVKEQLKAALECDLVEAAYTIRICLAYWVLCRGTYLRSEDFDAAEVFLGSPKGRLHLLFERSPECHEDLVRQLRNTLYDTVFHYVVQLGNKSIQRSFQSLVPHDAYTRQSKVLNVVIEESPLHTNTEGQLSFTGLSCQAMQVLQVATAFRGLHNLQRVLEADHVIVPPYLNSIRQKPHAQLLVQFLFSRNGGLIPFLAHSPINMEDASRWLTWIRKKPFAQKIIDEAPNGSLVVDWLGQWFTTGLRELTKASWIASGSTLHLIEGMLRSATATRMCSRIPFYSSARRLLNAAKDSLAFGLLERPVLVVDSSDTWLTRWLHGELNRVEEWQSFGFPVVARLEDLPKYCPRLFGATAFKSKEETMRVLQKYVDNNDFISGRDLLFCRSTAYNSLYAFELAAKSIEQERESKIQSLGFQWEALQLWKAKLQNGKGNQKTHKSGTPGISRCGMYPRLTTKSQLANIEPAASQVQIASSGTVQSSGSRRESGKDSTSCETGGSLVNEIDSQSAHTRAWPWCVALLRGGKQPGKPQPLSSLSMDVAPSSSTFPHRDAVTKSSEGLTKRNLAWSSAPLTRFSSSEKGSSETLHAHFERESVGPALDMNSETKIVGIRCVDAFSKCQPRAVVPPKKHQESDAMVPFGNCEGVTLEKENTMCKTLQERKLRSNAADVDETPAHCGSSHLESLRQNPCLTQEVGMNQQNSKPEIGNLPASVAFACDTAATTTSYCTNSGSKSSVAAFTTNSSVARGATGQTEVDEASDTDNTSTTARIRAMWRTDKKDRAWRGLVVLPKTGESNLQNSKTKTECSAEGEYAH
ncbi:Proteophosphoglycan ppg4, related, related, partial [Eimeria necatrix]